MMMVLRFLCWLSGTLALVVFALAWWQLAMT